MSAQVTFIGDVAFFPKDFEQNLQHLRMDTYTEVLHSDLLVGNLEFPFSTERVPAFDSSYLEFVAPRKATEVFEKVHFDVMTLANNHIADCGPEGLLLTRQVLEAKGIKTVGAGESEEVSRRPIILHKNDISLGILAYCKKGSYSSVAEKFGAAPLQFEKIVEDVRKLRPKVDHVVLLLHWGVEFSSYPYPGDVKLAHQLIDCGVDCVVGHHPHVVQGLEVYSGKPIFYSIGSFIYNPYFERVFVDNKLRERLTSIAVQLEFTKDAVISWKILPFCNDGISIFPSPMSLEQQTDFEKHFREISAKINDDRWFYSEAGSNLLERELKTIAQLIVSTKGKYVFTLAKMIRLRHLNIIFGKYMVKLSSLFSRTLDVF